MAHLKHILSPSRTTSFLCALYFLILAPGSTHAQTTGGIRGRIADSATGETLEGALVVVEGNTWGNYSNAGGEYRIFNLTPGTYNIKVSFIGSTATTIQGIKVKSGQVYVQDVKLTASPIELEGMVIEASKSPILEPGVTETRQTISDQEIEELPVDDIQDILELQSGVIHGTIRGGRIGQEVYVIDGVTVKNFLEGSQEGLGVDLGVLSVQELSVVTSSFSAEHGQALSGVINLVTKEGGREHAGALRVTSDGLVPDKDAYGYNRLEVSAGGPIDRGKHFRYFFSLDGTGQVDSDPVAVPLDLTGGRSLNRLPHNEGDNLNLFGKLSWWASRDYKLSLSHLSSRDQQRFYDPHYKYNLDNTLSQRTRGDLLNISLNRMSSSSSARTNILDARVSLYRNSRYFGVLEEGYFDGRNEFLGFSFLDYRFRGEDFVSMAPQDQAASGGSVPGYSVPSATGENAYGVQDTSVFVDSGQNPTITKSLYEFADFSVDWDNRFQSDFQIKTGAEFKMNHTQTYQRLNAYVPGGVPNYVEFYPMLGASYVQGRVAGAGLVLDLGMRFDMFLPRIDYPENFSLPLLGIRSSENKFALSPRLGATITFMENNLFRISYGIFRQTPDFQYLFDVSFSDPFRAGNRRRGNPELQFERTNQYEVAYSRAFTNDFSLTAGAYVKQLEHLVASRFSGGQEPQNSRFFNDDFGSVKGVELVLKKRMSEVLGLAASYTYQKATGMASDAFDLFGNYEFDPEIDQYVDLPDKEVPLDFDQRHTADISVEARVPDDIGDISALLTPLSRLHVFSTLEYGSGLPYTRMRIDSTVTLGVVKETLVPAELPNASRLPFTLEWNLKLSRGLRFAGMDYTFFLDIRNILGKDNILYYDPRFDSPWNSESRLRELARQATEDAFSVPAESEDYTPQSDLDGDRVITPAEQEEAYYQALVERWRPVLTHDEPRLIRLGMGMRF